MGFNERSRDFERLETNLIFFFFNVQARTIGHTKYQVWPVGHLGLLPLLYTMTTSCTHVRKPPGWAPGPCVSEKLLDDSDATGPWTGWKTTV